jgi:hypothetical protein
METRIDQSNDINQVSVRSTTAPLFVNEAHLHQREKYKVTAYLIFLKKKKKKNF